MFKLARTNNNPASPENSQRGYGAPGEGAQVTGGPITHRPVPIPPRSKNWLKGVRSWLNPDDNGGSNMQRGFPVPENALQHYPAGALDAKAIAYGLNEQVYTPYFSRGADAFVQNYGKVLYNPIGAGVVAMHRPQASYGKASEYHNGVAFFTPQNIPTAIPMQGLSNPDDLSAALGPIASQAAARRKGF